MTGQLENPEKSNSEKYFTLLFSLVDLSTSKLCKDRSYSISASVLTPHCYHNSDFGEIRVYTNCFLICLASGIKAENVKSFFKLSCQPCSWQINSSISQPFTNTITQLFFFMYSWKSLKSEMCCRAEYIRYSAQIWNSKNWK